MNNEDVGYLSVKIPDRTNPRCDECRHSHKNAYVLECRYNAPLGRFIKDGDSDCYSAWPKVSGYDWCSKFEREMK